MRRPTLLPGLLALPLLLLAGGCLPAGDEHNAEVRRLLGTPREERNREFQSMPAERQAQLLVSAWKHHPVDRTFNDSLAGEGLPLAQALMRQVGPEDGYVVTVEFLRFLDDSRARGMTPRDLRQLGLDGICERNALGEPLCRKAFERLHRE